jgi:signal peptidase I
MEPALQRGDILFLNNNAPEISVGKFYAAYILTLTHFWLRAPFTCVSGDIVVFKIAGRDIPIVHRVLWLHKHNTTGHVDYLTKGDNNNVHDRYCRAFFIPSSS